MITRDKVQTAWANVTGATSDYKKAREWCARHRRAPHAYLGYAFTAADYKDEMEGHKHIYRVLKLEYENR